MRRLSKLKGLAGRVVHRMGGATRSDLDRLRQELDGSLADLGANIDALSRRLDAVDGAYDGRLHSLAALSDLAGIESLRRWIANVELRTQPLISVILPTHDRAQLLKRAVASVLAQRYPNWELVIVEDGADGESQSIVDAAGDQRIRHVAIPHRGVCAARNVGLEAARGEIIGYLDDDNVMDPGWLYAVAWAFEQRPDVDVLYGAFVIDDVLRTVGERSGALPQTFLRRYRREALTQGNLSDIGAIAHRAGLPAARFDASLRLMGDWDLLVRLTAERDPLVLPAIACYYTTDAPDRLSNGPSAAADAAVVIERARAVQRS